MTTIVKPRIRVPAQTERWSLPAVRPKPTTAYMRGEWSPFFRTWRPALREASIDVAQAYSAAAARAIDTVHNLGWIAGAVDQIIAREIGTGLRLSSRPDLDVLKWTTDEAQDWARNVERRWEGFATRPIDCDLSGRSTVGKLAAQAPRSQFCYGEIVATLPFLKRPDGGQYGTKVNVIPPHRLLHHYQMPHIFDGITREPETGYPLAYRIGTPLDFSAGPYKWRDIPARDGFGRPQMIHVFDGWAGQVRGIPPITPVLRVIRQFDQLADATLMQALIQAIFAATIKSPAPTEQVLQAFQDMAEQTPQGGFQSPMEALIGVQADWYEKTDIDIGQHGKIAHLAPGDELEFHGSKTPHEFYEPFTRFLLREVARAIGITFEELTGDYSGATYSSVRMATAVTWAIVRRRGLDQVRGTRDQVCRDGRRDHARGNPAARRGVRPHDDRRRRHHRNPAAPRPPARIAPSARLSALFARDARRRDIAPWITCRTSPSAFSASLCSCIRRRRKSSSPCWARASARRAAPRRSTRAP
jgi:lambda family phage portal protein